MRRDMIQAGIAYFAIVFAVGFCFGAVRVPLLVPHWGVRAAELAEMPFMLAAIIFSARFAVRHFALAASARVRLPTGLLAFALLVGVELGPGIVFQGRTLAESITQRDPISGSAYFLLLGLFAAMPYILGVSDRLRAMRRVQS